jgi:RecB family endonuclease NucS
VALRRPDIKPDQLRLRQKMVDERGVVGLPGKRRFEIDILAQNGQISVFEVKSYCKWGDVDQLNDKVTFIQALNPDAKVEGIMIALAIGDDVREHCAELGITLVCRED